jgi:hypothetical protein
VVVFEISPSHMKTFHYPPQRFDNHQILPAAVRRLCVGSAESEDQQVRRPHHVQVQSPISRTTWLITSYYLHLLHVFIPLDFHRFTIKLLRQFPHTAKLTSVLPALLVCVNPSHHAGSWSIQETAPQLLYRSKSRYGRGTYHGTNAKRNQLPVT